MAKKIIRVWMPAGDYSVDNYVQEDIIRAVEACGGYILADIGWNYVAVGPEPFTPEEASEAMKEQSGDVPLSASEWINPQT